MTSDALSPLIPRSAIFADPEMAYAQLSPNGNMLAYLAPVEGKVGVWVRTIGQENDRVVARDALRPIPWAQWQGDGQHVLYLQDSRGDENYHLFRVGLLGHEPMDLTPVPGARALPLAIDFRYPDEGLITMNARTPSLMDVHRVNFATGSNLLDIENPGDVQLWLADNMLQVRAAVAQIAGGNFAIRVRDVAGSEWRVLDEIAFADGRPRLVAFSPDNRFLYAITAKNANADRLVQYELSSGAVATRFEDPAYDVVKVYIEPDTREIGAAAVLRDRLVWTPLSDSWALSLKSFEALDAGEFSIASGTKNGDPLILQCQSDTSPEKYFLYSRETCHATLLFHCRPNLLIYTLAAMKPITFSAGDGLRLSGYLTLPVGLEPQGLPTVLYVHGGPWHRDRWGFDPVVQWLANRGYAVLQVNFRGSTGYGKAFLNAGNREWAGAMRTDLLDARDWAIKAGYADPARCAIFGMSYGGYATLTALAWTPDAFRCGIDVVGPSDLTTFLASIPPYWEPMRKLLEERVGDEDAFLKSQSPLYRVSSISAPLLIAQGANDPRVKKRESDQIVQALRENGREVEYLIYENEGHGLAHQENLQHFAEVAESFLARHLGGRAEP
ncbi:S9 family peptidase [Granulicella tundricola]|uniref:Peptidase S9, prolyl oligopeptidase n=1 Tax=Granulicella tundricola (strain ATCC BAA-1859 / DSM 23138 / MP5ACTX9) TaxID=1198114 RepID=E8X7U3_GRATM|nr:S9 family peptidase [Granulicella tundricola]ADW71527.1 peptidase S9, prolyl oligopeptidase [Granulicella tundricola MP5ACTX9]